MLVALPGVGAVGYWQYVVWIGNPRVARELTENPDGERAQKVMLLTLPSGREIPVNYLVQEGYVYAAADGRVEHVHDSDPDTEPGKNDPRYGGNAIDIRHENSELSIYVHLLQGSSLVKVGDRVRRGQKIAAVGCSGRYVDFPHLHFQVNRGFHSVETKLSGTKLLRDGGWIDPGAYVPKQEDILRAEW